MKPWREDMTPIFLCAFFYATLCSPGPPTPKAPKRARCTSAYYISQLSAPDLRITHRTRHSPIIDMITCSEHQLKTRTSLYSLAQCCLPIITKRIVSDINLGQRAVNQKHVSHMFGAIRTTNVAAADGAA